MPCRALQVGVAVVPQMKHLLRLDFFPPQHLFPDPRGFGSTEIA
ncbi:hypothetical protein Y695_03439 [Hydrogenophaga sp. T4]|nr:hypothetical protein Y695_03439 [Hydrogenophaga sp. T4]